jgi:1-acyl-sn-glycerol-3-phosphate acyltransferase
MKRKDDPARESIPLGITRRLVRLGIRLTFRVRLYGVENIPATGSVLLAGNHSGWLDGPMVMITLPRPTEFLVKSEMFTGVARPVLRFARQIPIHRGTPDRTALQAALAVLAGGGVLGVFPEGTRGSGDLSTIQHGIGYLALRGDSPVVPVVCRGTAAALPKGKKLPRFRAPIDIYFGPAFRIDVPGDPRARSTVAAAAEQVRERLLDHLQSTAAAAPADPVHPSSDAA